MSTSTTDAVDDGLTLARRWEQAGVARFRDIAYDLFRFGARVYAVYQPQFLNEFVLDNLEPTRPSADYVGSDGDACRRRGSAGAQGRTDRRAHALACACPRRLRPPLYRLAQRRSRL